MNNENFEASWIAISEGAINPLTIIKPRPRSKIGLRTLPKMSIVRFFLRVNKKINRQEKALNKPADTPGKKAFTVEYDKAMHLGMQPKGPIKAMIINEIRNPGHLPKEEKKL